MISRLYLEKTTEPFSTLYFTTKSNTIYINSILAKFPKNEIGMIDI